MSILDEVIAPEIGLSVSLSKGLKSIYYNGQQKGLCLIRKQVIFLICPAAKIRCFSIMEDAKENPYVESYIIVPDFLDEDSICEIQSIPEELKRYV